MTSSLSSAVPGDHVGRFSRPAGFATWNRFAAANDEFVDIHMSDEAGRSAGQPGAFGMGNLLLAYSHQLLDDVLGATGRLDTLDLRFDAPARRGTTVTVEAIVLEAGDSGWTLALEVADDSGRRLAHGQASVRTVAR